MTAATEKKDIDMHILFLAAIAACIATPAMADTVTVQMKNFGGGKPMMFDPPYVQVKPGDTVVFKATDKGHDARSITGMLPDGAAAIAGKMGQDVSVTFSKSGLYGIKCTPHYSMGMVALVKVGDGKANAPAARTSLATLPPLARKAMAALMTQAGS